MAPSFRVLMLAVLPILALPACSSGGGGASAVAAGPTISGKWDFEDVNATAKGLDYTNISRKPIRGALVQLVEEDSKKILATGITSETGAYRLVYGGTATVIVRVSAKTTTPPMQVEDNTNSDAIWVADSPPVKPNGASLVANFTATLGYTATIPSYDDKQRTAAPFAILNDAYEAAHRFLRERPDIKFPLLKINWSPKNKLRPGDPDYPKGLLGAVDHYQKPTPSKPDAPGGEIYLAGEADVDTTEFDSHTIVHEWGHFLEATQSRSDSSGGPHSLGDILQLSLAFSEGWGYALSAIVLDPDVTVRNVAGQGQTNLLFAINVETPGAMDPNPGWYAEFSNAAIIYDLVDDRSENAFDQLSIGLGSIYDVMSGPQKNTVALTSIFSFLHFLKQANPTLSSAIDEVAKQNTSTYVAPVTDEWGSSETRFPLGLEGVLPVYARVSVGGAKVPVTLYGRAGGFPNENKLPANRLVRFTGNGARITITVSTTKPAGAISDHNAMLELYENGKKIMGPQDKTFFGDETMPFDSKDKAIYVLKIIDRGDFNGSYRADVSIN